MSFRGGLATAVFLASCLGLLGSGAALAQDGVNGPQPGQDPAESKGDLGGIGQEAAQGAAPQDRGSAPPADSGTCLGLTAREAFDAGMFQPDNPTYPVTRRYDFAPQQEGEEMMAVRKFECDGARSFVLFTKGTFRRREADGTVVFQRSQNLSVVNNYNQSGDAWNFAISSASKDDKDTWCLPMKEFCTKKVDRRAHGLKDAPQAEVAVLEADAYSLRHGEDMVLQAAVTRLCGKPPAAPQVCMSWGMGDSLCQPVTFDQAALLFPQLRDASGMTCPDVAQPADAGGDPPLAEAPQPEAGTLP